jgi:hypothetical protein
LKIANKVRKRFRNSILLLYKIYCKKYPISAKLKNGQTLSFENFTQLYAHLLDIHYNKVDGTAIIQDVPFHGGLQNVENLYEVFIKKEYDFLDVENKIVVDVGANIADSSIYFVRKGAIKVIGLEPNKENFEKAMENICLNGMKDQIDLLQMGCGDERLVTNEGKANMVTLESIMDEYANAPKVLKIDCEGCEYEVILNSPYELLSNFSQIQIEYHYGYKNLKTKLEKSGFDVRITGPRYFKLKKVDNKETTRYNNIQSTNDFFLLGWLYANKIKQNTKLF